MTAQRVDRRSMLKTTGAVLAGTVLAGCIDDSGSGDGGGTDGGGGGGGSGNTVASGPGGSLKFEPKEITISTGETVTWEFESAGHNVSAYPEQSDKVTLPDGAEPFGTEGVADDKYATVSKGTTFEHTFETAGEYQYVCVPHASSGMVGTVIVEE